ncbi:MAG: hypothetical protein K8R73_16585, partial [Clostridiales bacterium]|nr:hypothetical protein [Clostridiales bacterium]
PGIIALVLLILTTSLLFAQQDDSEIPQLDFERINAQYHTNRYKQNNDILETMTTVEIFEFAYELVLFDPGNFGTTGLGLVPYLNAIKNKQNYDNAILQWISNENYHPTFRNYLIDTASHWISIEGPNYSRYQEVLAEVAFQRETSVSVRSYAVSFMDVNDSASQQVLSDLYDQIDDPALRRPILTKMRRTNNPALEGYVAPILTNPHEYDERTLSCAIRNLIPDFDVDYIDELVFIAQETESELVYMQILETLGRMNTAEAVIAFMNILERFDYYNDPSSSFSRVRVITMLRGSHTAVEGMLTSEQSDEYLICGLQAVRIGDLHMEMDVIEALKPETSNTDVQSERDLTLEYLRDNQEIHNDDRERAMYRRAQAERFRGEK